MLRFKKNKLPLAAAAAFVAMTSAPVYASTLSGSFSGSFSAPTGQTSATLAQEGAGTGTLSWGASNPGNIAVEAGDTTTLSVSNSSFDYQNIDPGNFLLGTITWNNHSNWHAGGIWSSVMTLDLSLDTPDGTQAKLLPVSFTVYNTTDLTVDTDHNETTGNNPDFISGLLLDSGAFSSPINLGNGLNLTEIFFQLDDAGTAGQGATYNGVNYAGIDWGGRFDPDTGAWATREGGTSVVGIYGAVSAVPLPAGMWLLLSAVGGAAAFGRRKKSA